MPNNKAKLNGEKIASVLKAWKDICPAKSFAGMTLAQFTAKVQPSLDAREHLDTLEDERIAAETDRANADAVSMPQVNLVVNARDAMPKGGMLTVSTEVVEMPPEFFKSRIGLGIGPLVLLRVSDTGSGMSDEITITAVPSRASVRIRSCR